MDRILQNYIDTVETLYQEMGQLRYKTRIGIATQQELERFNIIDLECQRLEVLLEELTLELQTRRSDNSHILTFLKNREIGKGLDNNNIDDYSNPDTVYKKAKKYLGNNVLIKLSDKPSKKYMVLNPHTNKFVYFGQMGYSDFTKTGNENKRYNYLRRTENMRGNWRNNKYSANNLSRNILW